MNQTIRQNNEDYLDFVKRVSQSLTDNEISVDDWANAVLGEESTMYSTESWRRCSVFFRKFLKHLSSERINNISDEGLLQQTLTALDELKKEKIKVQTATLDYNNHLRADARHDMFIESVEQAISKLEPLQMPDIFVSRTVGASALLCLSDFHAGSTYEVKGMYGEVVNKYDYNIMCERLMRLIGQIDADDMVYDDLTVAFLGDFFEGILRESSLVKLREPVIDTVIRFSEFLSNWIVQLQNRVHVPIKVITVGGNHDVARFLGSKPQFEDENFGKLVVEFMKLRLQNFDYIQVCDYTDCYVSTIRNINIAFQHGEDKNLEETINYFSNLYNVDIQEIYCGHLHQPEYKSIGIADVGDRMCFRVGSVCGVDTFAKKIRRASRASCKFVIYDDNGHSWDKTYYMN